MVLETQQHRQTCIKEKAHTGGNKGEIKMGERSFLGVLVVLCHLSSWVCKVRTSG